MSASLDSRKHRQSKSDNDEQKLTGSAIDEVQKNVGETEGMIPGRKRRRTVVERGAMRMLATGGIIGIGVALGAILAGQNIAGWMIGLIVSLTSVILAAILWSSRQL